MARGPDPFESPHSQSGNVHATAICNLALARGQPQPISVSWQQGALWQPAGPVLELEVGSRSRLMAKAVVGACGVIEQGVPV